MPFSRRKLLTRTGIVSGLLAATAILPRWFPRLAFAPDQLEDATRDVLVVVFLRGGADALSMVVPYADDHYYQLRPRLAIPRPDASRVDARTIDLDGYFGIHPALASLLPIVQQKRMTAIHAVGSPHETRSHFEAMDYMERGTDGMGGFSSGWVARHLATLSSESDSPVRGVGWGVSVQQGLLGIPSVVAMKSITDFHLQGNEQLAQILMRSLSDIYKLEGEEHPLYHSANSTVEAIQLIDRIRATPYRPSAGVVYPTTDFASALQQTAMLIKAQVGLEASYMDLGGWDTHAEQGATEGRQADLMSELAGGLAAFHADMGNLMERVTVVVMSEFGRRVAENESLGTDHGHGGMMLVMNDKLNTPMVTARWAGLAPEVLYRGEDLPTTTDYRDVLIEVLQKRLNNQFTHEVFMGYQPQMLNIFG